MTFDSSSGIPANAELVVEEIREGDEGYEEYVAKSAEKLGETAENVALAKAFDITLRDPESGEEYQPTKDVLVSVELLQEELEEYESIDVVHIHRESTQDGEEAEIMDSTIQGEAIEFVTDGFSVFVLMLSRQAGEQKRKAPLTITADSGSKVYDGTPLTKNTWSSEGLLEGDSIESVTITGSQTDGGKSDNIPSAAIIVHTEGEGENQETTDVTGNYDITYVNGTLNVFRVSVDIAAGDYNNTSKTIEYTVEHTAKGDLPEGCSFTVSDLTTQDGSGFTFVSGTYQSGEEGTQTEFNTFPVSATDLAIKNDGDTVTLKYSVLPGVGFSTEKLQAEVTNEITVQYQDSERIEIFTEEPIDITSNFDYVTVTREFLELDGSWAYWRVTVNPDGYNLNGGQPLTLADTFHDGVEGDASQSIDYSSIEVSGIGVTYDYRDNTGTGELLKGATFTVKKAKDDAIVTTINTTDDGGNYQDILITGGDLYESEVLYYVTETIAPAGYMLPQNEERYYFYFCNDSYLIPSILADLPEGETAVNLTENAQSIIVDNKKEKITVPVMKIWQGSKWPHNVADVTVGLYQSVDGAEPTAVPYDNSTEPRTVRLTALAPYNNTAFSEQLATVSGCSFKECSARTAENSNVGNGGGAICANGVSELSVSYCEFSTCDTLSRGGAIVVWVKEAGTVSINYSSFDECNCKGQGGALAVYQQHMEDGKESADTKKTKLSTLGCQFNNCSSGTNNGSGGAIQCYVPCMEFTDSTFTDCWAGKEGGAVNNYFGNGYTAVWTESYMMMNNCRFIRCRAEDRYDPTAPQHYGGGVNTNQGSDC